MLTDENLLTEVVLTAGRSAMWDSPRPTTADSLVATSQIRDEELLSRIILSGLPCEVRLAAVEKVFDDDLLTHLALEAPPCPRNHDHEMGEVRIKASERVTKPENLFILGTNDNYASIDFQSIWRLARLDMGLVIRIARGDFPDGASMPDQRACAVGEISDYLVLKEFAFDTNGRIAGEAKDRLRKDDMIEEGIRIELEQRSLVLEPHLETLLREWIIDDRRSVTVAVETIAAMAALD